MSDQNETLIDGDIIKIRLNTKNKRALANGAKKIYIARGQFIVERNRRIALRRALIVIFAMIVIWGAGIWIVS